MMSGRFNMTYLKGVIPFMGLFLLAGAVSAQEATDVTVDESVPVVEEQPVDEPQGVMDRLRSMIRNMINQPAEQGNRHQVQQQSRQTHFGMGYENRANALTDSNGNGIQGATSGGTGQGAGGQGAGGDGAGAGNGNGGAGGGAGGGR
jgi:hypothetical protein